MRFETLLDELRATSKPKEKMAVIEGYYGEDLRYILQKTYDPFIMFHVKIKPEEMPPAREEDLSNNFEEARGLPRRIDGSCNSTDQDALSAMPFAFQPHRSPVSRL